MEYRMKRNGNEPAIDQGIVHGHPISWNPDDNRFYVMSTTNEPMSTFADWRNAVYYAKTH